jgi:thymidine kinase
MTHILLREVFTLGRIDKGVKCSVSGCGREAVRSLSTEKVRSAGLNVGSSERRAYLCKEHYKEYKKKTKKDKQLEKWRYSG